MKPQFFGIIFIGLALAGCQSREPKPIVYTVPEYVVIKAPPSYYTCPSVKTPNPDTLTNRELGAYLIELNKANVRCRNSLGAVRTYIDKAEKTINPEKPVE